MAEIYCDHNCILYQRGLTTKNREGKCKFDPTRINERVAPGSTPCRSPNGPQDKTRLPKEVALKKN